MDKYVRFKIEIKLYHKLDYISKHEFRSVPTQVRQWIKEHIRDFENLHGEIKFNDEK